MRLTKDIVTKILLENEGMTRTTYYKSRNFRETRNYLVKGGKLLINAVGKTSWADSRFDEDSVADFDQARRFIRKFILD